MLPFLFEVVFKFSRLLCYIIPILVKFCKKKKKGSVLLCKFVLRDSDFVLLIKPLQIRVAYLHLITFPK